MIICPNCRIVMKHIRRFKPDSQTELYICPSCFYESKEKSICYHKDCNNKDNKSKTKKGKKRNVCGVHNNDQRIT